VIWFLVVVGVLLVVLGVWGGPVQRRRAEKASRIPREATVQEAWDILTSPVQYDDEVIKIPEQRPWFLPGSDRRFQRGVAVGLGAGLLLAALLLPLVGGQPAAPATEPGNEPGLAAGPTPGSDQTGAVEPGEQPTAEGTDEPAPPEQPAADPGPDELADVTFTVEPGSSSQEIAANLKAAGLIEAEEDFLGAVAEMGVETALQAGTFVIPADASVLEIVETLTQQ